MLWRDDKQGIPVHYNAGHLLLYLYSILEEFCNTYTNNMYLQVVENQLHGLFCLFVVVAFFILLSLWLSVSSLSASVTAGVRATVRYPIVDCVMLVLSVS